MAKKEIGFVNANFTKGRILTEDSNSARNLHNTSQFGVILNNKKVKLSLVEALYLLEKKRLRVLDGRNKEISEENFIKKAAKLDPFFWVRYCVFKDLRNRGYIVKTALKFGAEFRVYDRGVKPGEDHAKWLVFPVHETDLLTWYDFSAKMRVAHSTRKKLLIGCVDEEEDVTYYTVEWVRP